ncbi:hypothetical protein [Pseudomonas sp. M30-35]|uniref:hypothetical protein n=1 Tax=Pseudomonas sp. M30-35 TaxID=1981174 RepID=UPI000B3CBFA8|nr:hypothetical protein [Pseudomonas sp. M30-35]ARU86737.1 hypothetical protein B9K09_01475 [Pseudomonas sp. M30-35]
MSTKAKFELHALNLGKLVGNLLTIEMAARMFLAKHDEDFQSKIATQLPRVSEGDLVESDAFTNADDLRQTLQKYNKRAPNALAVPIDEIVSLRDALAHGRTFGFGEIQHLRLLKFSRKAAEGKHRVELAQDMSETWFVHNIRVLESALQSLTQALDYEQREFD